VRDYVLPDYTHIKRGHVRTPGETSTGNEQVDFTAFYCVQSAQQFLMSNEGCHYHIEAVFFGKVCKNSTDNFWF